MGLLVNQVQTTFYQKQMKLLKHHGLQLRNIISKKTIATKLIHSIRWTMKKNRETMVCPLMECQQLLVLMLRDQKGDYQNYVKFYGDKNKIPRMKTPQTSNTFMRMRTVLELKLPN